MASSLIPLLHDGTRSGDTSPGTPCRSTCRTPFSLLASPKAQDCLSVPQRLMLGVRSLMVVGVQHRDGRWRLRPSGTTTLAHRVSPYGRRGWVSGSYGAAARGLA